MGGQERQIWKKFKNSSKSFKKVYKKWPKYRNAMYHYLLNPADCTVSVFNVISAGSSQKFGSPCEKSKNIESKIIPIFPKKNAKSS